MRRNALSLLLALTLCISLSIPALAASDDAVAAADRLYELGLFKGVGTNTDGSPNYDLDRAPNRMEAVTLLVRLLGKEAEAKAGSWTTPFTDVADWAKPYVGYAYENGLTKGTSATTFGGTDTISATQYLTFVLRALGYDSGSDFAWDSAWELTDKLDITSGEYGSDSAFTRGDAVLVSASALDVKLKDGSKTLIEAIEEALASAPKGKTLTHSTEINKASGRDANGAYTYKKANLKTTLEILSAREAVITWTVDAKLTDLTEYVVTFIKGSPMMGGEGHLVHIGQIIYGDDSDLTKVHIYELVDGESTDFSESATVKEEIDSASNTIIWRVTLPGDSVFTFDAADEFAFKGNMFIGL